MLGFVCPSQDRKEGSGWDAVELELEFEIDEGGVVAGGAVVRAAGLRRGAGGSKTGYARQY